jgi:hypothetical protein
VLLRLTATSSDGVDSAGRVTRAELTEGKSPAEAQEVEAVLEPPSPPNGCSPWPRAPWN